MTNALPCFLLALYLCFSACKMNSEMACPSAETIVKNKIDLCLNGLQKEDFYLYDRWMEDETETYDFLQHLVQEGRADYYCYINRRDSAFVYIGLDKFDHPKDYHLTIDKLNDFFYRDLYTHFF